MTEPRTEQLTTPIEPRSMGTAVRRVDGGHAGTPFMSAKQPWSITLASGVGAASTSTNAASTCADESSSIAVSSASVSNPWSSSFWRYLGIGSAASAAVFRSTSTMWTWPCAWRRRCRPPR